MQRVYSHRDVSCAVGLGLGRDCERLGEFACIQNRRAVFRTDKVCSVRSLYCTVSVDVTYFTVLRRPDITALVDWA